MKDQTTTAALLTSLDAISHETTLMLGALDGAPADSMPVVDRREAKRRILDIRARAHELFEWLSEVRLEDQRN